MKKVRKLTPAFEKSIRSSLCTLTLFRMDLSWAAVIGDKKFPYLYTVTHP